MKIFIKYLASFIVPYGGFKDFGFKIVRTNDITHLPVAHTW